MKHTTILTLMPTKSYILILLLISLSTTKCQSQTALPPAGLLCISDCETCPVICSAPPSSPSLSSSPPPTPKLPPPLPPPPPVQHYSPPQLPYYFDSPSPSSPPAHPPPPPPSSGVAAPRPPSSGGSAPPPPSVYVYNPGTTVPSSGMGPQRNFSFPYYYFYASKADSCYLPLYHQGTILLMLFILFPIFA